MLFHKLDNIMDGDTKKQRMPIEVIPCVHLMNYSTKNIHKAKIFELIIIIIFELIIYT